MFTGSPVDPMRPRNIKPRDSFWILARAEYSDSGEDRLARV